MALAAQIPTTATARPRSATVCRVHTCVRCKASIENQEPCSFVRTTFRICVACRGQEQVLLHFPTRRANWAGSLARNRAA
jgi:hypothetical protein